MKTYLQCNLANRTVALLGGSDWEPPVYEFGEKITLAMRFTRTVEGVEVEHSEPVQSLRASIGRVDARPDTGTTRVQIGPGIQTGDNTTNELPYNASPKQWQDAINAKAAVVAVYGEVAVTQDNGSLLFVFGAGTAQVPMQLRNNKLRPRAFGRFTVYEEDGVYIHELRLIQLPVEMTSDAPRVLPPPPSVTRIQEGGSEGDIIWNEIQAIYVPPEFRGTYQLKKDYARTALLSRSDQAEEIQEALQVIDEGFAVTNPIRDIFHVEFGGEDMEGQTHDLLEVIAANAPEGDITFTLDLERADLLALLRPGAVVRLWLSVWVTVLDDDDEVEREQPAFGLEIQVRAPLIWPELATVPNTDWLRRPSPKDYLHGDIEQTITGTQSHVRELGDDVATVFPVEHGLATSALHITVHENQAGGAILKLGVDYSVVVDSEDEITVTALDGAPAVDAWRIVITSAGTVEALNNHLHSIAQVTGLSAALEELGSRVAALEERFPEDEVIATPQLSGSMKIEFTPGLHVLFSDATDLTKLSRRAPFLLPAVHDASVTDPLPDPLPSPTAGTVWQSDREVLIPVYGKTRASSKVQDEDYVAADGRSLYPVRRVADTDSYYPIPMEIDLIKGVYISESMLAVGKSVDLRFAVALQLLHATSHAQAILVIEKGTATDEALGDPDTSGVDLEQVEWDTENPILSQRIILMPERVVHSAGVIIKRNADALLCTRMIHLSSEGANALAPATPNFALRARLINFDTENSATDARGWLVWELTTPGGGELAAIIG